MFLVKGRSSIGIYFGNPVKVTLLLFVSQNLPRVVFRFT